MSIYDRMKNVNSNVSYTENGMEGYKTTSHPLCDMNFKVSSYRSAPQDIARDIDKVMATADSAYILKWLFMLRDVREGLGERDIFRIALKYLLDNYKFVNQKELINTIINSIGEYGRYDDLLLFFDTNYENEMLEYVGNKIHEDLKNAENGKSVSLLAKWMPSENASSPKTKAYACRFIKAYGISAWEYRRTLSKLRKKIDLVETKASFKQWDKIDYNTVPSGANLKYKDAFLRNDKERRRDYLASLRLNVEGVKMNGSTNFPHDIVHSYGGNDWFGISLKDYNESLEQLWKNLKQYEGLEDTIVVRDGSDSMTKTVGVGTNTTALDVSTALAIYCAEHMNGDLRNHFITFSSTAELVDLSRCNSLREKLERCYDEYDCSNTNISSVFNLLLKTAKVCKIAPEDMPKRILIISDMEFDGNHFGGYPNVFEDAAFEYAQSGYKLPKLIFWNVNSRSNTIPMLGNDNGLILVSGFSVSTLKLVMSESLDPFDCLIEALENSRYDAIPLVKIAKEPQKRKLNTSRPWALR